METFGQAIKRLRKAKDYTLAEVSSKVGISVTYLSQIENGARKPPCPEIIDKIAIALWTKNTVRQYLHDKAISSLLAAERLDRQMVATKHSKRKPQQR
jgi:transcriptional regulator with XRE-family HTH domain